MSIHGDEARQQRFPYPLSNQSESYYSLNDAAISPSRSLSTSSLATMDPTIVESTRRLSSTGNMSSSSLSSMDMTVSESRLEVPTFQRQYNGTLSRSKNSDTKVGSMLISNSLRSCREVEEVVSQCMFATDVDQSIVCQTAKQYLGGCTKKLCHD